MAKALNDFVFEPDEEIVEELDNTGFFDHPRLDVRYLWKRTQMFQKMTQGRGKPMTYGVQKKDKK